ncbi:MAG: uracil-DNA glycosylase [Silicimonas sp.]|nr:uracil-DNA glycosylase [Silicimonas sp.]RZW01695.1 MAG: uracil-DNA glycosylase [Paracoccaceae bacterium]
MTRRGTTRRPDVGQWSDLPFFRDDWPGLAARLADEPRTILPPDDQRFAALARTQPDATRVVILGQDPYPTRGHANGLAFSVAPGVALPKSLRNIYRELEDDLGRAPPDGDLSHWADQGVLLLNTALTVPEGDAGGHAKLGWNRLTKQILARLSDTPRAFLLWGRHAQDHRRHITRDHHLFIETAHPSPLAAYRGFFGSRPFSRINRWLEAQGGPPIRWS